MRALCGEKSLFHIFSQLMLALFFAQTSTREHPASGRGSDQTVQTMDWAMIEIYTDRRVAPGFCHWVAL